MYPHNGAIKNSESIAIHHLSKAQLGQEDSESAKGNILHHMRLLLGQQRPIRSKLGLGD